MLIAPAAWKLAATTTAHYTLTHGRILYARGSARLARGGTTRLVLRATRHLRPGRYQLTVQLTSGRHHMVLRRAVTIR